MVSDFSMRRDARDKVFNVLTGGKIKRLKAKLEKAVSERDAAITERDKAVSERDAKLLLLVV